MAAHTKSSKGDVYILGTEAEVRFGRMHAYQAQNPRIDHQYCMTQPQWCTMLVILELKRLGEEGPEFKVILVPHKEFEAHLGY